MMTTPAAAISAAGTFRTSIIVESGWFELVRNFVRSGGPKRAYGSTMPLKSTTEPRISSSVSRKRPSLRRAPAEVTDASKGSGAGEGSDIAGGSEPEIDELREL